MAAAGIVRWPTEMTAASNSKLACAAKAMAVTVFGIAVMAASTRSGDAQSLDEAVLDLLKIDGGFVCKKLLNLDLAIYVLQGPLLGICNSGRLSTGATSAASGGGAATVAMLPGIVQKRLRESGQTRRGKSTKAKSTIPNAYNAAFQEDSSGEAAFSDWNLTSFGYGNNSNAALFEENSAGVSIFIAPEFETLKRDVTSLGDGYDSEIWHLTAGVDYQFSEQVLGGIALDYYRQDGDFAGGGRFDTNSYGVSIYGVFEPVEKLNLQVVAGYVLLESNRVRPVLFEERDFKRVGIVESDSSSIEYHASVIASYDLVVNQLTVTPRAGLDWRRIESGSYCETGNTGLELRFSSTDDTLLLTRVGLQATLALETDFGIVAPQVSIDWLHDLAGGSMVRSASFVGDKRPNVFSYQVDGHARDYFELSAGVGVALSNGIQGFANYRTLIGHNFFDSHAVTVGLRVSF
jgi:uncharacterized protein YhjY with autotransporter beta-barrel domain